MSPNSINPKRLSGLSWLGAGAFALAGISQARVQLVQRQDILDQATATERFIVSRREQAKRGGIFDREGRPLAQDEETRFLTVRFDKVPRSPAFFLDLAAATGIPATEFASIAETTKGAVDWRKPIGAVQAAAVQDVKQRWRADGVGLSPSGRRSYPLGETGSGLIGAMRDKTALSGVELGKNGMLAGIDGKIVGIVDREGNYLPMRLDRQTVRRRDGSSLTLTLDSELQQAAAEAVKQAVNANKADQGVAIVMDPRTGDILAMANWPSFDPNKPIEVGASGRTPEFNAAYMAALEPGSTFKVLTLAKALDKGVVQPDDTYYCRGSITIRDRVISCDKHHGTGAHGLLDPEQAIARSCNLAAANWARKVGHDDFVKYMEACGLMEKPGLGLPRESRGLYNYKDWTKDVQLATNGFGQSMNYTPLALCAAFAMLGNDGKRVHPRLVMKVDDSPTPIAETEAVISPDSAHQVLQMMKAVMDSERGTGKGLRIPGYEIGGKTGTAQKKNFTTGNMKGGGYVSNFVGFVPAEQPKAVILVMVDNPKAGLYYGASVAGPVFKSIAQNVIRRLHIPKTVASRGASHAPQVAVDEPVRAPSPFVQETSSGPEATKKKVEPRVEVKSREIRPAATRTTTIKIPASSPLRKATADRGEPAQVRSTKRTQPRVEIVAATNPAPKKRSRTLKRAEEGVVTSGSAAAVIRVANPRTTPARPKASARVEPVRTRSIRPQLDELRRLGKEAAKKTLARPTAEKRPTLKSPKAKPKAPGVQSAPKRTLTQSQVRSKRSVSERVNR